MNKNKLRLATALGLATAMMASLGVVGSAAFGKSKPSAAQDQYKVAVCHRTKSKKKPFHTINVSVKAASAHLRHGDTLGPCVVAPSPTAATSSDTSSTGKSNGNGNGNGHGKAKGKNK
jgi:hypothetical protein